MESTQHTIQQVNRAIDKIVAKYPQNDDTIVFTDLHMKVLQDTGDLLTYDDDGKEINRCVIEEWINNKDDNFYPQVTILMRDCLKKKSDAIDSMGIAKPFSFVLENDDDETIAELYLADDETIIIGGDIMDNLDSDLNQFFEKLMQ